FAGTSASDDIKNRARDVAGNPVIDNYFQLQTRSEVFAPHTAPSEVSRLLRFVRVQFADRVVGQIQVSHCSRNVIELLRYEDRFNLLHGFELWASFTIVSIICASEKVPNCRSYPGIRVIRHFGLKGGVFNLQRG